jgi:hypothetical protein
MRALASGVITGVGFWCQSFLTRSAAFLRDRFKEGITAKKSTRNFGFCPLGFK